MTSNTSGVESLMARNLASFDSINEMSMPVSAPQSPAISTTQRNITPKKEVPGEDPGMNYSEIQTGLAGGKFMLDVINAQSAYQTISGQAQLNIMQARNSAADALSRGRQAQLDAQSIGYEAGQSSVLAMAAQGQDVSGAAANRVQGSYEAMGVFNGMREEINSMREALGYELEEVNYDYQVAQADIQRTNSMIGSALNFGATAAYYGNK